MTAPGLRIAVCVRPVSPGSLGRRSDAHDARTDIEDDLAVLGEELAALQLALDLAAAPGGRVTVVCVGGPAAEAALRRCLALGAAEALRVDPGQADLWDSLVTARILAAVLAPRGFDLILGGTRSSAGMHGVVGPALARLLDLPLATGLAGAEPRPGARALSAVQRLERGDRWAWRVPLPAVCLVTDGAARPGYLAVRRAARFADARVDVVAAPDPQALATAVHERTGELQLESLGPPKVRVKRTAAAAPKATNARDRLKALRGGGPPAAGGDGVPAAAAADGPRRLTGDPATVARELTEFLAQRGFL